MVLLYLPAVHKAKFNLVSIKTAVGSCWVACIVFGIFPFMSNSKYSFVAETVSPQWDMILMFAEEGMSRSDIMEANSQRLTWTFILCEVIPILLPATFLLVSTIVLILRMDYKKRRDLKHSESSPAKKKYDPFNLSTREFAMRIASNLGMDSFYRNQNSLHGIVLNNLLYLLINTNHQVQTLKLNHYPQGTYHWNRPKREQNTVE